MNTEKTGAQQPVLPAAPKLSYISDAARILRAGDQYSESNKKIRNAVDNMVDYLSSRINTVSELPKSLGWVFLNKGKGQIEVQFLSGQNWVTITTHWDQEQMWKLERFCEALRGAGGQQLISWMEEKIAIRSDHARALEAALTAVKE